MPAPRLRPSPRLALFGALVALSTPAARGQGCEAVDLTGVLQLNQTWAMNRIWIHPQTNPPGEYDRIGRSVDVCGRVCAVGVPMFDWPEHTGGEREDSGWASWMTIHPSESMVYNDEFPPTSDWFIPTEGDEAGFDVSLDESPGGDYTFRYAFSLPGTNGQRGRVCITHLGERCPGTLGYPSDWMYMALEAPDASPNDRFGHSIAIDGKVLVAGAPQDDDLGSASGSAYVFRGNELEAKLLASDGEAFDRFGDSVALDGDLVLVGAPRHDQSRGAVYVYTRDSSGNWYQEARLTAWDAGVADTFGQEVALHDGWAVIGAPWDDDGANGAGAAYVFERVGQEWEPRGKIVAYDAVSYGNFG
ncbi:MAG: FG-GAP repeat protein, partial [Planctomycetota bacterium]